MTCNKKYLTPPLTRISKTICRWIEEGKYCPGTKLPAQRLLARKFNASEITVHRALNYLVDEGILYRHVGSGTFVKKQTNVSSKLVAVLMPLIGDIYAATVEVITRELQLLGYHPLFLELSLKDKAPQVFADRLNEIVNSKPAGIIIAGGLNEIKWYEELIKPLKRENIGIIYRDNTKICSRFTRILTDDSLGWYLGTKHLLELGHRNILIMAASHHVHLPMREGCQLAFTEYDIDWNFEARLIPGRNSPETKKILYRYISSLKRPTAIFASSDCQAVMAYFVAMQLGLRIPEDLSLIGYYNTPWVEKIDIPLTSVFIKEQYIGQIIVEKMFGINSQFSRNTTTLIEPELIIRNSTSTLR